MYETDLFWPKSCGLSCREHFGCLISKIEARNRDLRCRFLKMSPIDESSFRSQNWPLLSLRFCLYFTLLSKLTKSQSSNPISKLAPKDIPSRIKKINFGIALVWHNASLTRSSPQFVPNSGHNCGFFVDPKIDQNFIAKRFSFRVYV